MTNNRFHKRRRKRDEARDTGIDYISQMGRSRRFTFPLRVPIAIANMVDALVDGDDTLKPEDV